VRLREKYVAKVKMLSIGYLRKIEKIKKKNNAQFFEKVK
jgi:hypothetical protein